jgi:hypothetical protein
MCLPQAVKHYRDEDVDFALRLAELLGYIERVNYREPLSVDVTARYQKDQPTVKKVATVEFEFKMLKEPEELEELWEVVKNYLDHHDVEFEYKKRFMHQVFSGGFFEELHMDSNKEER